MSNRWAKQGARFGHKYGKTVLPHTVFGVAPPCVWRGIRFETLLSGNAVRSYVSNAFILTDHFNVI